MSSYNDSLAFVQAHLADDPTRLLLAARRFPEVDMPWVVEQIEARNRLRSKLPEWFAQPNLLMCGRLPAEQCSSEPTARYKQRLVRGASLADLTGGMGVDCYYMSQGLQHATYVERQPALCEAARHNFAVLGATHIEVVQGDGREVMPQADTIYLDPARRAVDGSRVYDVADCEPNVVELLPKLLRHARRLVVKISPMADLSRVLQVLPEVGEIHVLAVRGECKEVVLVVDAGSLPSDVQVTCVDFVAGDAMRSFTYMLSEEPAAPVTYADACGRYLYEPDVTLLKAGAFRLPAVRFGLKKLEVNSHCYTSDELVRDFPGRIFEVDEDLPFASRILKSLRKRCTHCNITARNFPLTADQLRAKSGLKDGGDVYLMATTVRNQGPRLLFAHKAWFITLLVLLNGALNGLLGGSMQGGPLFGSMQGGPLFGSMQMQAQEAPCLWKQGKPFVCLNAQSDLRLVPEGDTTLVPLQGSRWTFLSMLSTENWLGQQTVSLRFCSPDGMLYRYDTERGEAVMQDTTYHPVLPMLYPMQPIADADQRLRGETRYLLINDETVVPELGTVADSLRVKFVAVQIDSVTYGTECAPIRIWFSRGAVHASVCASLPESREAALSRSYDRVFAPKDPHLNHPMISDDRWRLIQHSKVCIDMTPEEVCLAWGRPTSIDKTPTRAGLVETWLFPNGGALQVLNGRVLRIGRE